QQQITRIVSHGVVDALELIQIEKQQGQGGTLAAAAGQCVVQAVHKQAAVGQAGQGVEQGQLLHFPVGLGKFGNINGGNDIVSDLAKLIAHGGNRDGGPELVAIFMPAEQFAFPTGLKTLG